MLKITVKIVCLIALPLLTTFWPNGPAAYADDPPTQLHQYMHRMDYTPAKMGTFLLGQPLVHVKLNSTTNATFLVDTGSSASILGEDLAKSLNLHLQPAVGDGGQSIHLNGHKEQAIMTQVNLLEIGSINANNVPFLVLPNKTLRVMHSSIYDGVIGVNILEHSAILLDGQQHQLGFCLPGTLSSQQLSQIGLAHPYVLPLSTSGSQWFIQAIATNEGNVGDENLLLDTGSNMTDVSESLAQKIHLKITNSYAKREVYSAEITGEGQVDRLQIGDLTLLSHPVAVRPQSDILPSTLGMDILSNYRVLIDFPAKKMYLQSNTATVPTVTIEPQTPGAVTGR